MLWRPWSTGVTHEHMLLCMLQTSLPPRHWNHQIVLTVWLIGAYPVVLRKSQESRRQEVAQLGKQRKPGLFTGRDISLLVSKTGSNEPPLRWVWQNRRRLLKHDLPFLNYPRLFHTRGDVYLKGYRNSGITGRDPMLGGSRKKVEHTDNVVDEVSAVIDTRWY